MEVQVEGGGREQVPKPNLSTAVRHISACRNVLLRPKLSLLLRCLIRRRHDRFHQRFQQYRYRPFTPGGRLATARGCPSAYRPAYSGRAACPLPRKVYMGAAEDVCELWVRHSNRCLHSDDCAESIDLHSDLGLLKRDKKLQVRYNTWAAGIREQYGSMGTYTCVYAAVSGSNDAP